MVRGRRRGAKISGGIGRAASTCLGRRSIILARIARSNAIYLVVGVMERDAGTLYCTVLFFATDGSYLGQTPKADADGIGAARLGLRRRIDAAGVRNATRQTRRCNLLGKLHAAAADYDVFEGHRDLLRADCGRARLVAGDGPAHCGRGAMLRAFVQSVPAAERFSCGLSRGVRRRSGRGDLPRRELHRGSFREFSCGAQHGKRSHSDGGNRSPANRARESTTSMSWATMRGRTFFNCRLTSAPSVRLV